jgi:UDP-N-acetylglucosamine 2-epimerase (non-hydrolysing)
VVKVVHVVGARPNFMKAAPVYMEMARDPALTTILVHTGQHYDDRMSDIFFRELGLPRPEVNLGVGSGSHATQTAGMMVRFEEVALSLRPDWVFVYGDVNSTVACALVAAKLGVKVAHVEAGLRSRDWTMPEEINRVVTDRLSDLLFTPSPDAGDNLKAEGVPADRIHWVGNCMIDTLVRLLPHAERPPIDGLDNRFVLLTLHRPATVDDPRLLGEMLAAFDSLPESIPVIFPVHPRTRSRLADFGVVLPPRFVVTEPLGYLAFLWLQQRAFAVVTDSGGVQEETTYLGTPCLTVRDTTERPITCASGSNQLVGRDPARLRAALTAQLQAGKVARRVPDRWDGLAAERIARVFSSVTGATTGNAAVR